MSYSSDHFEKFEAAEGAGKFARAVEAIDSQGNPANALVLRALAHAAELGERPEDRISEMVTDIVGALFAQESSIESHSYADKAEKVGMGGAMLPFLIDWRLSVDLFAPDEEWPITSLEHVNKIEFMLYPQPEGENDASSVNDILCTFGPSAIFTRNNSNRWAYDRLDSSLLFRTQTEVLDFLAGLNEGIEASK